MSENGTKISDNYHSDHSIPVGMGSSASITRADGEVEQHLQYMPFGETFIDQRIDEWSSRYTFSAKEKDLATGYNYFGARYYDSEVSVWLSVDPLTSSFPDISPYNYVEQNSINYIDEEGENPIGALVGAVAGFTKEVVGQTLSNGFKNINEGKGFFKDWGRNMDWADVFIQQEKEH